MPNLIVLGAKDIQVLYVYPCSECGQCGDTHLAGDGHEGEVAKCSACGATVTLEWDGGVVLEHRQSGNHTNA